MARAMLEPRRGEVTMQALAGPIGQAPCPQRERADAIGADPASCAFFAQPAVQMAIPQEGRCGQEPGLHQVEEMPGAYVCDHDVVAPCRQTAECGCERGVVLGFEEQLRSIRHRRWNRPAELRRELPAGGGINGDAIEPQPRLGTTSLDGTCEEEAVDEVVGVDVDQQRTTP